MDDFRKLVEIMARLRGPRPAGRRRRRARRASVPVRGTVPERRRRAVRGDAAVRRRLSRAGRRRSRCGGGRRPCRPELRAFAVSRDLQGFFLYRENGFPPATLNGLLRAHPYVLSGEMLIENYHYAVPGTPAPADGGRSEFSQTLSRREERHEQVARLRRQATRLGRLRDFTSSLLSRPSSPNLLNAVTDSLTALGYRMCWAGMARPDGTVEPAAVSGDLVEYLKTIPVRWDEDPLGGGPTGTAIRTGRPDIVHDVRRSIFGIANRELVKAGFFGDPYAAGRRHKGFIPFVRTSDLTVSAP